MTIVNLQANAAANGRGGVFDLRRQNTFHGIWNQKATMSLKLKNLACGLGVMICLAHSLADYGAAAEQSGKSRRTSTRSSVTSRERSEYAKLAGYMSLDSTDSSEIVTTERPRKYLATMISKGVLLGHLKRLERAKDPAIRSIARKSIPSFTRFYTTTALYLKGDGTFGGELLSGFTKVMAVKRLRMADQRLEIYQRSVWPELRKVAKRLSAPPSRGSSKLTASFRTALGTDRILVTNGSKRELRNCTLEIRVDDFSGYSLTNTYYLEKWPAGKKWNLPAGTSVSIRDTVGMRISLWSRDVSYENRVYKFTDYANRVAERKVGEVAKLIKSHRYASAISLIKRIKKQLGPKSKHSALLTAYSVTANVGLSKHARLAREKKALAREMKSGEIYTGRWRYQKKYSGSIALKFESVVNDGEKLVGIIYEPGKRKDSKRVTGRLTEDLSNGTIQLTLVADSRSGIRRFRRGTPSTKNLLVVGDRRKYTFTWKDRKFTGQDSYKVTYKLN